LYEWGVLLQRRYSLLQQMLTVGYPVIFFGMANVNTVLTLNEMKLTLSSNCFQQLSLAWRIASVSSSAGVFLNTYYKPISQWKNDSYDSNLCCFYVLNNEFVDGLSAYRLHILFRARALGLPLPSFWSV